jgi:hypothetical protein
MAIVEHTDILVIVPKPGFEYLFDMYNGHTTRHGKRIIKPGVDALGRYFLGANIMDDPEFDFDIEINGTKLPDMVEIDTLKINEETE